MRSPVPCRFSPFVSTAAVATLVALCLGPKTAESQQQFLNALLPTGQPIAPIFEGWYANPDGTFTFSFGFHNFNSEGFVHVPLGDDNFFSPAELDPGTQPTMFNTADGRRQQGAFAVRVPAEFADGRDLVWTITAGGKSYSVPGHVGVTAYELDYLPRAGDSVAPLIGFESDGARGQDPEGIIHDEVLSATVGVPIDIAVWTRDPSERPDDDSRPDAGVPIPVGLTAVVHQGPAPASFEPRSAEVGPSEGEDTWTTRATFHEPGSYVVRIRADNWTASDSSGGNQCCWTNGYVRIEVE